MRKNSGNILLIILAVAGILAASVGGYFWWTSQKASKIVCGTIAGNLPEHRCPRGYRCELEGNYPDAAGKCVREIETFKCPYNGRLNCMPILTPENQKACKNLDWFKKNCPNFQGAVY